MIIVVLCECYRAMFVIQNRENSYLTKVRSQNHKCIKQSKQRLYKQNKEGQKTE